MVAINFTTLLTTGSQTVVDADGDPVTITATFTSDFFVNGAGNVQSDNAVDTSPDTFTLTFSKPVKDFTFTIGDVNSNNFGGGFNDRVVVESTFEGDPITTNLSAGTSGTTAVYEAPFNTNIDLTVTVPGPVDQITLTNFDPDQQHGWLFFSTGDIADVVCFTGGTLIETPSGPVVVEELDVGDLILTRDHGPQPLRWIGHQAVSQERLSENDKLLPIRVKAGSLANGVPNRDLVVSRQHRILAVSKVAERMFGHDEVLVPANKLTSLPDIEIDTGSGPVTYYHLLFDQHQIIYAEGAPVESLHTGPQALKALSPEAQREILTLFPEFFEITEIQNPVRYVPTGRRQKQLVERLQKNQRRFVSTT